MKANENVAWFAAARTACQLAMGTKIMRKKPINYVAAGEDLVVPLFGLLEELRRGCGRAPRERAEDARRWDDADDRVAGGEPPHDVPVRPHAKDNHEGD